MKTTTNTTSAFYTAREMAVALGLDTWTERFVIDIAEKAIDRATRIYGVERSDFHTADGIAEVDLYGRAKGPKVVDRFSAEIVLRTAVDFARRAWKAKGRDPKDGARFEWDCIKRSMYFGYE